MASCRLAPMSMYVARAAPPAPPPAAAAAAPAAAVPRAAAMAAAAARARALVGPGMRCQRFYAAGTPLLVTLTLGTAAWPPTLLLASCCRPCCHRHAATTSALARGSDGRLGIPTLRCDKSVTTTLPHLKTTQIHYLTRVYVIPRPSPSQLRVCYNFHIWQVGTPLESLCGALTVTRGSRTQNASQVKFPSQSSEAHITRNTGISTPRRRLYTGIG